LYAAFAKFETWISWNTGLTTLKKLLSRGQHWCDGLLYGFCGEINLKTIL
jgi:hypothetical protein